MKSISAILLAFFFVFIAAKPSPNSFKCTTPSKLKPLGTVSSIFFSKYSTSFNATVAAIPTVDITAGSASFQLTVKQGSKTIYALPPTDLCDVIIKKNVTTIPSSCPLSAGSGVVSTVAVSYADVPKGSYSYTALAKSTDKLRATECKGTFSV